MCEVTILHEGYSRMSDNNTMVANCTCTLVTGPQNIIVDTMTAWDEDLLLDGLKKHHLSPDDIDYVVCTHGHSDHIGNNNLFLNAKHIVGFSVSHKNKYFLHPFDKGEAYIINKYVKVIPTPGHTLTDVTVLVTTHHGVVAIAGDLFEKYEDIEDSSIWRTAGSENPLEQMKKRLKVAGLADWIVPGHGGKFEASLDIEDVLRMELLREANIYIDLDDL